MRRLVLVLAMAAVLATAAPAWAADGDPYVRACAVVVVSQGCNAILPRDPWVIAASPDDRQVYYTTSSTPSVLQIADHDPATGTLTPRADAASCFAASGPCTRIPFDVAGAYAMAMSHDGRTLLVSAGGHVLGFARDLTTGALTYSGEATGNALGSAEAVAFSPDDRFVYVRVNDGLDVLHRDLTQASCYADAQTGPCTDIPALQGTATEIGVSRDVVAVPFFTLKDGGPGGGVAVFKPQGDGTLQQLTGTSGGCVSYDGQVDDNDNQCLSGPAGLTSASTAAISPDARFVYVGAGAAITALPLTAGGALQPPVAGTTLKTVEDLVATNDALVASTFGGVIHYYGAGTLTPLPGAKGCMNADGSGGCTRLGGLNGSDQTHTFLAADPGGLNVYATSDTNGMLATIVRDYGPTCHAASVAVPYGTATAIHLACADPNGDPLTYAVTTGPAHGSLVDQGGGSLVYTPAAGFSGADQFSFAATGHGVTSAPATTALAVAAAPVVPPVVAGNAPTSPPPLTKLGALVATRWEIHGTRFALRQLTLSGLPKTWTAQIRCAGKRCPFARRTLKGKAKHGTANVLGSLKRAQRRFRAGQTLEVWVSAPGHYTKVARLVLKKGKIPATRALCAVPGAKKAASHCG